MVVLARLFREPLEAFGGTFIELFGTFGLLLGTFLADGFHFPVPPQFYMVVATSSGMSAVTALTAITAGSLLGGLVGYRLAGRLARFEFVARRLERMRALAERALSRFGTGSAVFASLLPIPYSVLCYLAGLHRLPLRFFLVLAACRIPRLLLFYYLVQLGWSSH